jgi:hypothetical protein
VYVRVCVEYSGPDMNFSGSVRKTGPTVVGLDGPRSSADGPAMRRSVDLPPICAEGCGCSEYAFVGIP